MILGNVNVASSVTEREPQVRVQIANLEAIAKQLGQVVTILGGRLEIVSQPNPPTTNDTEMPVDQLCAVADHLRKIHDDIRGTLRLAESVLNRLEV